MDYTAWMKTMGCVLINIEECISEDDPLTMIPDLEHSLSLWPFANQQHAFDPINDELVAFYEN